VYNNTHHQQQQQFATTHGKVGLALFVVITLQLFSGSLRGMGIANRGNKFFGTNYDRLHQVCCMCSTVLIAVLLLLRCGVVSTVHCM
jgi:hypothetical protein